jgi:selenocysteine lyase/cysteine desulfurase
MKLGLIMDKTKRSLLKNIGAVAASFQLHSFSAAIQAAENNNFITKNSFMSVNGEIDWSLVRQEFNLDEQTIHLANFLITSHPRMVRDNIDLYRTRIDRNPATEMHHESIARHEQNSREWAAKYLQVKASQIAITGSTTEGLGLIYNGLKIKPDQEVLTSVNEHWATKGALRLRSEKDGIAINTIKLFKDPHHISTDEVISSLSSNITKKTRVLALTWVHSSSGVKLPIGEIGKLVNQENEKRSSEDKIIFCVDGVHGLGVENITFDELNCDYLIAGTHKWMFGPRGTAIICSRTEELDNIIPTIDTFSGFDNFGTIMTPGGFHAFEHQWAMSKAFEFHLLLGKEQVQSRIHQLNNLLKEELTQLKNLQLVTPQNAKYSAGFTFFRIKNADCDQVAKYLLANRVAVDATDREVGPVVRMAPGLLNNEQQIEHVVQLLTQKFA